MKNLLGQLSDSSLFAGDYAVCRESLLHRLGALDTRVVQTNAFVVAEEGDSPLFMDTAWIGDPQAEKVIVLISGTHGVEGYAGSAVQRFILDRLKQQHIGMDGVALLMIHALNPWGMYWARRCDQAGIDLNRNFLDFAVLPGQDGRYSQVLAALEINDESTRMQRLAALAECWGQRTFDEIFSGGQYQHPWAPFYGGTGPAKSNCVLQQIIEDWQLGDRELIVIDLHTGLGPYGYGELISDHPVGSAGEAYAAKIFGAAVASTEQGESFSVSKRGLLDFRWHELMRRRGCFLTLEFGTLGTKSLFNVLLSEHLFWRGKVPPSPNASDYMVIRAAMLRHFFPTDALWRQSVLFRGWQIFARAVEYLNG